VGVEVFEAGLDESIEAVEHLHDALALMVYLVTHELLGSEGDLTPRRLFTRYSRQLRPWTASGKRLVRYVAMKFMPWKYFILNSLWCK
jgi:hypothetical protein